MWFIIFMYNIMVAQNDREWKKKEPTLMQEEEDFFFSRLPKISIFFGGNTYKNLAALFKK